MQISSKQQKETVWEISSHVQRFLVVYSVFTLQLYNPAMLKAAHKLSKRKRFLWLHQRTAEVRFKTSIRQSVLLLASFCLTQILQHLEPGVSGIQKTPWDRNTDNVMLRNTMSSLTFTKTSHAPECAAPRIIKYVSNTAFLIQMCHSSPTDSLRICRPQRGILDC